jgi:FkbM family methyltransferase
MNAAELAAEKAAVRDFLGVSGFFVEVGAHEPTSSLSQTWHLEQSGWRGILIEPIRELTQKAARERAASVVVEAACTSPDKVGELTLCIPVTAGVLRTELAATALGIDEPTAASYETRTVPAKTLDQILGEQDCRRVDFISIDVEGTELEVLKGFDLRRWQPRLVLIEDKWVYFDKHRHLTRHGYRLVKRTGPNSWYVPVSSSFEVPWLARMRLWRKLYLGIWPRKIRKALEMKSLRPLGME